MIVDRLKSKIVGSLWVTSLIAATSLIGFGQTGEGRSRNNPYSPSPSTKPVTTETAKNSGKGNSPTDVSFVMQGSRTSVPDDSRPMIDVRPSIAQATFKIARAAETKALPPTETYKIGIGDVLFISLKNLTQGSGYFTVRSDGTIDYPLAGERVLVADQLVESVEDQIASGITLYKDPQVEVKVRQFGSHKITVSGLVENGGDKSLQREAMPLFVIKAEAVVSPKATSVSINRGPQQKLEVYDLRDPKTDDVLILPGNAIEFNGTNSSANGSFFIGGEIAIGGQKDLTSGLTLYQAVIVSGGTKGDPKKAIIRRKNEKGLFNVIELNLRSIKEGKAMDPFLAAGDVIEIKN